MILNLGCGNDLRQDSINCDITCYPGVDMVVDLGVFPWPWPDNSIDGIHAAHIIEHLPDPKPFILECLRILKPGGFLRLKVPHSSNISAVGCLGHYRTFSYDTLNDYLARDFYYLGKAKFRTVEQKFRFWYEVTDCQGELTRFQFHIVKLLDSIITPLANISPRIWENVVCPTIQMREVIYTGVKL